MEISDICEEVKEALENGFCEPTRSGMVTYCAGYKKKGCPETCYYAKIMGKIQKEKTRGRRIWNSPRDFIILINLFFLYD